MELRYRIIDKIKNTGSALGFDEYLNMVLYDREKGYYCQASELFGPRGDFITAPERSKLFAGAIANQILQIMHCQSVPSILEIGAGSGVLARDILVFLQDQSALPENYFIVEQSPALKAKQQKLLANSLPDYIGNIHWVDFDSLPEFRGVVLANEVFDALPFKRISLQSDQIHEMKVTMDGENFHWQENECVPELELFVNTNLPVTAIAHQYYKTEVHVAYESLLNRVSQKLSSGIFIIIDYGMSKQDYYSADRTDGTMRCFFRHTVHDNPFIHIGEQDITCDVEFSLLLNKSRKEFDLLCYTTQANFLLANGIDLLYEKILEKNKSDEIKLASEFKTLLMPDEMGERFKVMLLSKGYEKIIDGFSIKDLSYTL